MSLSSSSSRKENDSFFFHTIQQIYLEQRNEYSPDQLYQIWIRSQTLSSINHQGYAVVNYLEDFIVNQQLSEEFFCLIIKTLAKNEQFYQSILNDRKRFERLFGMVSTKSVYLLRYVRILYGVCPKSLLNNVGLDFYRFVMENYLKEKSKNLESLAIFSSLIYQFHENNNKIAIFIDQKQAIDYSMDVIDTLLQHDLNVTMVEMITKTIAIVWEQTSIEVHSSVPMRSIEYLFQSISTDQSRSTLTPAIIPLFAHIQLDLADTTLKSMFSDGRLTGERLFHMIRCLIGLIDGPIELLQAMSYDTWITGLCNALVTFHQHEYLRNLIDQSISFYLDRLFRDPTFDNAFQILFWFILYDKRLEPLQMLIDRLPKLFEQFQLHRHEDRKTRMIELCQMGMAIHPDYQISNGIVFKEILHTLPQPDLNILANHRATHARFHSIGSETRTKIKHRLGMINLGNTCYVNSVVQALYQCDLFRKYILENQFHEQMVLKELQMIFAQLYLSKRSFVNAINLMKIARPAWFTMNEQQDCAEFLGYLLDTIKDEEKKTNCNPSSNEIERFFTIRTCQINRCQACSIESYREEMSNYLFLPIPTVDPSSGSSPPSYDSLINQSLNLQFVFDCYFQKEDLKDDNQYRCEHCRSLQDAERSIVLRNAPEYLILSLNRFEYDKTTNIFRKIFTKINYPKVLHVPIHPSETSSILTKYCLVLVIVHTGYTLHGGHYYVYAREVKPSLVETNVDEPEDYFANDEWFLLNDDLVTLSSYEAMIENCAQYTSATPYILFYKRVDQQRLEQVERTKAIQVHKSLQRQIEEDNLPYERDRDVS